MKDASLAATLLAIALGAVAGAWARYGLSVAFNGSGGLAWGTLVANWGGALAIGAALAVLEGAPDVSPLWRAAGITGFLGALTTFSAFSAESLMLLQQSRYMAALVHSALHVAGSLAFAGLGYGVAARL